MSDNFQWNLGDIFDALDESISPNRPALIHDDRVHTWSEIATRSNNLAQAIINRGGKPQDKVAFYLANCPEYLELAIACLKTSLIHVNVNFRYLEDELHYIIDNSDAKFVVYSSQFADRIASIKLRCNKVTHFIEVNELGEDTTPMNDFSEGFEALAAHGDGAKVTVQRSAKDMVFIYTGGTTGMPKGVMWEQHNLWHALGNGKGHPCANGEAVNNIEHLVKLVKLNGGSSQLIACPLMHGTGFFSALITLTGGGTVVTMPTQGLDPDLIWQTVHDRKIRSIVIVGDAFAKPMLNTLDQSIASGDKLWDLDSLRVIISSGVMWSIETKQGLLKHLPNLMCVDSFASSEAIGFGSSVASAAGGVKTARFMIGNNCKVFTEDHREVMPGSDERGFIARTGPIPSGYYKDPKKSDETFPVILGVRYSIPGDWCTVDKDGVINLLGRGSACINTAGEKVYPEEVEEVLKQHDSIHDALVIGLQDDKWGTAVIAVIELSQSEKNKNVDFHHEQLQKHVRGLLSAYKSPKKYIITDKMFRAPNGKADYKSAKIFAEKQEQKG